MWWTFSGLVHPWHRLLGVKTSCTLVGTWTTEPQSVDVTFTGNNVKYTFPAGTNKFARLKVIGP